MEILAKEVISFSSIAGDERVGKAVWQYIYGEYGVIDLLEKHMLHEKYGNDLIIVLIMLYIEGEADWFSMPLKPKLGRYASKDKSYRYSVPITKETFFCLSPTDRKAFLVQQMNDAVAATEIQFQKKKMTADFNLMRADLATVCDLYLKRATPPDSSLAMP